MAEGESRDSRIDAKGRASESPPKCIVDDSPLQLQMDKNKESLQVSYDLVLQTVNKLKSYVSYLGMPVFIRNS